MLKGVNRKLILLSFLIINFFSVAFSQGAEKFIIKGINNDVIKKQLNERLKFIYSNKNVIQVSVDYEGEAWSIVTHINKPLPIKANLDPSVFQPILSSYFQSKNWKYGFLNEIYYKLMGYKLHANQNSLEPIKGLKIRRCTLYFVFHHKGNKLVLMADVASRKWNYPGYSIDSSFSFLNTMSLYIDGYKDSDIEIKKEYGSWRLPYDKDYVSGKPLIGTLFYLFYGFKSRLDFLKHCKKESKNSNSCLFD